MIRRAIVLLLFAILSSGCSSNTFLGRRVDNFKAYYNTFYNARKAYDKGYQAIEHKDEPVDRDRYLPLFARPSGNTANREFENAVVKSADILREHENSKWVDDALLLIGKSYFYQENFVGALQKFREVIDRHSDLEEEARFWFARTLIISRSYDEALAFLQESLAQEDVREKWIASYRLALGELYVQRSDWESAADALSTGLDEAKEKELAARAQFLLGQVYETMDEPEEAVKAYQRVRRFNPLYELDFAARLSAIRVKGIYGDAENALNELRKMERDDKNFEYRDELRYLKGRIFQAQLQADAAYNSYFDLLYEENRTTPIDGDLRGRTHYAMAELHRDLDRDYVLAAAHFDTAAVSLAKPSSRPLTGSFGEAQFTRVAITDAAEIKANFNRYASVYKGIADMDSLLWLGSMSQEDFDAKILELRLARALLLEEQRKERDERLLAQQFRQASDSRDSFLTRGLPEGKIIDSGGASAGTQSGFLFHRDQERVADGRNSFLLRWGDRPLVPNWRRIEAVRGQPVDLLIGEEQSPLGFNPDDPTTLPEIDTSDVPRDSLSQAIMYTKRSISWLDLGNALFLALNMPDSAAVWYRRVIDDNPDEGVVQRSYYALAEVQKTLGDSLSASRLYDQILDQYPDSEFSDRIRTQRGIQIREAIVDSSALALELYELVFDEWQSGHADDLINQTVLIAVSYPGTDASAQALLAGGEFFLEQAAADREKILAPINLQIPVSLLIELWPEKYGFEKEEESEEADSTLLDHSLSKIPDSTMSDLSPALAADSTHQNRLPEMIGSEIVVESDSVGISPVPPDSLNRLLESIDFSLESRALDDSAATGLIQKDSLGIDPMRVPLSVVSPTEEEPERPLYFVEDLFDVILRDYGETDYAARARALRQAVVELRKPIVSEPVAVDISVVFSDSLLNDVDAALAQTDSLGKFNLALPVDSTELIAELRVPTDSLRLPTIVDALAVNPVVVSDSVAVDTDTPEKGLIASDTLKKGLIASDILPTENDQIEQQGWVMLDKYPDIVLDDEDLDGEFEYLESSTLKPLRLRRVLDLSIVGWTVRLAALAGTTAARKRAGEYAASMDTEDQKVMILKDVDPSLTELTITWGIFPSKTATDDAVADLDLSLPDGSFYILMTSLEDD
ncbi:MAG: tetratricopeptide repeat protein [Bacteroidetes bacterium]|nr:tetratricopeptide repeat protein [Bacteroidota bacterium]